MTCVLCCYKLQRWDENRRRTLCSAEHNVGDICRLLRTSSQVPLSNRFGRGGGGITSVLFLKERCSVVVARVWGCGHCNRRWKFGLWASRWLRCFKGSVEVGGGAAPRVWKADPGSELQPPSTVFSALKAGCKDFSLWQLIKFISVCMLYSVEKIIILSNAWEELLLFKKILNN